MWFVLAGTCVGSSRAFLKVTDGVICRLMTLSRVVHLSVRPSVCLFARVGSTRGARSMGSISGQSVSQTIMCNIKDPYLPLLGVFDFLGLFIIAMKFLGVFECFLMLSQGFSGFGKCKRSSVFTHCPWASPNKWKQTGEGRSGDNKFLVATFQTHTPTTSRGEEKACLHWEKRPRHSHKPSWPYSRIPCSFGDCLTVVWSGKGQSDGEITGHMNQCHRML